MMVWKRLCALTSTGALVAAAAVYVGGSTAAAQSSGVAFTSQPTVSQVLAHYVVSPTGGPKQAASASTDESPLATMWPKGHGAASLIGNTGGVTGNRSGSGQLLDVVAIFDRADICLLGRKGGAMRRQPVGRPMVDEVQQPAIAPSVPAVANRRAERDKCRRDAMRHGPQEPAVHE